MYTYTWKKYLPVIRLLLKRSASAEQSLDLNRTDFEKTTKLRKPVCSFAIEIIKGRSATLNSPVPAKDMLEILMQDSIAAALLRENHYAVSLNSDFKLSIKNLAPEQESEVSASEETQDVAPEVDVQA
jgi:hypothetical protein